ncbi:MAG: hypothetical protein AAB663_00150 [Patescibacteria group bacterium]
MHKLAQEALATKVSLAFAANGALLENGHYGLASGRHSPNFLVKTNIGMNVGLMEAFAYRIAEQFMMARIDVVLVPGTGAISLGHALAWQLSVLTGRTVYTAFAMRPPGAGEAGRMVLKRGFPDVIKGKNVLVMQTIDDGQALSNLDTLACHYGAQDVMRMLPLVDTCLKDTESPKDILTDPGLTRTMVERVEVRGDKLIDVVLVEAGHDIAVGHALALEIGRLQGKGRTPQLIYGERGYTGTLSVTYMPPNLGRRLRVLAGEDIITTGGSLIETKSLGETIGDVVGMAALWNRGPFRDPRLKSLVTRELPSFEPGRQTCPQCADGVPVDQQYGRGR